MLRRPKREEIKAYSVQFAILLLLFVSIYMTTNRLAQTAHHTYRFWTTEELAIPFIPEFIFVYVSLNLLTVLPLFTLNARQITALGISFAAEILGSGAVFYTFPAPTAWHRPPIIDRYDFMFQTVYTVDETANTFPSLHIALSFLCIRVIVDANPRLRLLWIWFVLISLSVLFTHQHHVMDIVGGILLAEGCFRVVYPRALQKSFFQSRQTGSSAEVPSRE